jgi:hypothetical protein
MSNKQPLPHQHGRAKARLSMWQTLMRNPPPHLARIGPALHTTAAVGDKDSLNSRDEDDNEASGVTDSG